MVSRLAQQSSLKQLQLRLGIDHTPYPLIYPPLDYRQYSQLDTVKLNQINSNNVLRTVGKLLNSARLLKHFYIDVDVDSNLKFSTTFEQFPKDTRLPLNTLYATGFANYGENSDDFWNLFFPHTLYDLTIEGGHMMSENAISDFWRPPSSFQHRIGRLSTNLIDRSLVEFVLNCRQLDTLLIKPCDQFNPNIDFQDLMRILQRPGRNMRCLALYPQGKEGKDLIMTEESIKMIQKHNPHLEELGVGIDSDDLVSFILSTSYH